MAVRQGSEGGGANGWRSQIKQAGPVPLREGALGYTSPLVLRRPVMRSPSLYCPRFFKSSIRSNRLSTFRFPPIVAAARKLRCCDITKKSVRLVASAFRSRLKRTWYVSYSSAAANAKKWAVMGPCKATNGRDAVSASPISLTCPYKALHHIETLASWRLCVKESSAQFPQKVTPAANRAGDRR